MKIIKKFFLGTATFALIGTITLSPVNLAQNGEGFQVVSNKVEAATGWTYVDTVKKSTRFQDVAVKATIPTIGAALAIPLPYTAPLSTFATVIASENIKTVYFKDKRSMRMAGHVFQTKHEITMYTDSSYTKKKGSTVTIIHNDIGGPKSIQQ